LAQQALTYKPKDLRLSKPGANFFAGEFTNDGVNESGQVVADLL
jgi:hypothetical protein